MPADIRVDRPDCLGELDGICVKMMQKDPKFRYQECNQVAKALETWLAKYKAENPDVAIKPSRGMTLDDLLEDAKSKGNYLSETVNNQLEDTKIESTKRSGQAGMALSSSDSGVLRAIVKSDSSAVDSQIDLIHDSSQPNKPKSRSQAIQEASERSAASSSSTPLIEPAESKAKSSTKLASPSSVGPKSNATGVQLSKTQTASAKSPTNSANKASSPAAKTASKPQEESDEDQGLSLKSILILVGVLAAIAVAIAAVVFLKS